MDFIGQRADQVRVTGIVGPVEYIDANGTVREGIAKEVEHYTMTCPGCGADGYYDEHGEVVCEQCGVVISGDKEPVVPYEYSETGNISGSRGLGSLDDAEGTHEPRI